MATNFKTDGVGTGPFTLDEFVAGERIVLVKNPDYWGTDEDGNQLPYLDKLTIRPIPDSGQRLSALETGDIDIFQSADSKTVKQGEDAGFAAQKISGSSSTILLFNIDKPPFDDVQARQAVAYAIDKDAHQRAGLRAACRVPSYSGFALDSPYYNPDAGHAPVRPGEGRRAGRGARRARLRADLHPHPRVRADHEHHQAAWARRSG